MLSPADEPIAEFGNGTGSPSRDVMDSTDTGLNRHRGMLQMRIVDGVGLKRLWHSKCQRKRFGAILPGKLRDFIGIVRLEQFRLQSNSC